MSKLKSTQISYYGDDLYLINLYHMTDANGLTGIKSVRKFLSGAGGMIGGGIYFALTPEEAQHKASKKGVLIEALVLLRKVAVASRCVDNSLTVADLVAIGVDTIVSVGHKGGTEVVVRNPDQILFAWVVKGAPQEVIIPDPASDVRPECKYGKECYRHNLKHILAHKHSFPLALKEIPDLFKKQVAQCTNCGASASDPKHFQKYSHSYAVLQQMFNSRANVYPLPPCPFGPSSMCPCLGCMHGMCYVHIQEREGAPTHRFPPLLTFPSQ